MLNASVLGQDTPKHLGCFIKELDRFLADTRSAATGQTVGRVRIVKDRGIRLDSHNRNWRGYYRCLLVEHRLASEELGIGVFVNKPDVKPPRKEYAMLVVKVFGAQRNLLQMGLKGRYVEVRRPVHTIQHDGRTAGAESREMLDYVRELAPKLPIRVRCETAANRPKRVDLVELGVIDCSKPMSWDQPATRDFIGNLVEYSIARGKFKQEL